MDERQRRILEALAERGLLPFPVTDELVRHVYVATPRDPPGAEARVGAILRRYRRRRLERAGLRILTPTLLVDPEMKEALLEVPAGRPVVRLLRGRTDEDGELLTGAGEVESYGILPADPGDPSCVLLRVRGDELEPVLARNDLVLLHLGPGPAPEEGFVVEPCERGVTVIRRRDVGALSGTADSRALGHLVAWCGAADPEGSADRTPAGR